MPEAAAEQVVPLRTGIDLCFDTFGARDDPAVLLVMGLGGPLSWWDPGLCSRLADRGFFVIRFDNRDVGHSTICPGQGPTAPGLVRAFLRGQRAHPPYTLHDLSEDCVALLDHLGITEVHLVGISMGGMVAQTLAVEHPDRVRSLVSMMSTTGRRTVGYQDPRLLRLLLAPAPRTRQQYVERSLRVDALIGSPGYPTPVEDLRARAGETFDRGVSREGSARQILAILAQRDRTDALRRLTIPATVIHGLPDKMVHVSGGRATAAAIPGAELILLPGLGHDLPRPLWPLFLDAIDRTARRTP